MSEVTRRQFLAGLGVAVGGAAIGAGSTLAFQAEDSKDSPRVPFHGQYQAGIVTPQQDRLFFASFDLTTTSRDDVRSLFKAWTDASSRMCNGELASGQVVSNMAPPVDTGEAMGLSAARLTLTFGFGPTFFTKDGHDRFGFASKRPAALVDIPPFSGDVIDPDKSDGDICVQACADDPQVAFHAVRNLARIARGTAVMRWSQLGFGRTATTSRKQDTPRNLMGNKDGTNNLKLQDASLLRDQLWVPSSDGPDWMVDGSYVVTRRIRMLIESWDRASLDDQEQTIGRYKASGAPLGETKEHDAVPLDRNGPDGKPVIPEDAHIRLAAPATNDNKHLLRRGYSFTDGTDPRSGQLDAGLFFIAFQRDPRTQFTTIQERLSKNDALNEYIKHTSSGVFAVPPGVRQGDFIGSRLFA